MKKTLNQYGQFESAQGGQFKSASGGQLKSARGGQFDRRLHFRIRYYVHHTHRK